jgi:hypothetical protein
MLPPFYQAHLQQCLSSRHYLLVNLLVLLLQWHKQVRLERLAANLPLPIQFEGRRRCLQRLFSSPQLLHRYPLVAFSWLLAVSPIPSGTNSLPGS